MRVNSLTGRRISSMNDLSVQEFQYLVELTARIKKSMSAGMFSLQKPGKMVGAVFEVSDPTLKVSVEAASNTLGSYCCVLGPEWLGQNGSEAESLKSTLGDVAPLVDCLYVCVSTSAYVETLAREVTGPALITSSDAETITDTLAKLAAVSDLRGGLRGSKALYVGTHGNSVDSLILGAAKLGVEFTVCAPESARPQLSTIASARVESDKTGGSFRFEARPDKVSGPFDAVFVDACIDDQGVYAGWIQSVNERINHLVEGSRLVRSRRKPGRSGSDTLAVKGVPQITFDRWIYYSLIAFLYSLL